MTAKVQSQSHWPTTMLGEILLGRQRHAEMRLRAAVGRIPKELWSKVVIEYSYAIAADRAGNDEHCKRYAQEAIELESNALSWDASHGL
jgi:hypothetical protein